MSQSKQEKKGKRKIVIIDDETSAPVKFTEETNATARIIEETNVTTKAIEVISPASIVERKYMNSEKVMKMKNIKDNGKSSGKETEDVIVICYYGRQGWIIPNPLNKIFSTYHEGIYEDGYCQRKMEIILTKAQFEDRENWNDL